ncbi:alpha-protein kinase 1-like [Armigeres subalbatus]|uniref:alpha-protein kinase 1-like n=1 Tax=Armigeres subalbatus TaxID=124917 RepID=UPI002ED22A1C
MLWMAHGKMKFVCIFALLLALVSASSAASDDSKDANTDVKRIRIDPALRKALLRALRNLKDRQEGSESDSESESEQQYDSNTTEENFATTILDELLEESTTRERNANIKYHSFSSESDTLNGENEIIKTIIISKPKTTLSPPKEDLLTVPNPIKDPDNELNTNQVVRSVSSGLNNKLQGDSKLSIVTALASSNTTSQVTQAATTTTTAAPTTTAKLPTHNADGENIERVKSGDVKIYQAPLVAAFTVQQDQLGVPRNVIPLLQSPPKKASVDFRASAPVAPTINPTTQVPQLPNPTQPAAAVTPIPLNTQALEEKTRILEQQLITLQTQQRIQEQLLRSKILQEQQIILQQQQQLQQQRVRLEEETRHRLQKFEEEQRLFRQQQQQLQQQQQQLKLHQQQQQQIFKPFPNQQLPNNLPPPQFQQLPQQSQQQPQTKPIILPQLQQPQFFQELPRNTPAVQFIPSVTLPSKTVQISVEQQLPFKEAVNFQPTLSRNNDIEQIKSLSQPVQQFPIIPPSPPQLSKQQLLPLKPFQSFNVNPAPVPLNIQGPLPVDQQLPQHQRNRVFRHESGTGNFGFNQQFRASQPIPIGGFQPLRSDNQLENLLVQSGITTRSAEDFNIITKVLALNHGIPQSSSQQMFAKLSPEQQQQLLFRKK